MDLVNPLDNRNEIDILTSSRTAIARQGKVHIRVHRINGGKMVTTIEGLASDLDITKIKSTLMEMCCCNGSIKTDPEAGEVVQLSGDQRTKIRRFLIDQEICDKDQIVLH